MAKNISLVEVDGVAYQIVENGVATKVTDGFYQKTPQIICTMCQMEKLGE